MKIPVQQEDIPFATLPVLKRAASPLSGCLQKFWLMCEGQKDAERLPKDVAELLFYSPKVVSSEIHITVWPLAYSG